jgi:type I restriction enzyme S subunit
VDFEFPNENGEPYKSSGGEMVDSELGLIPKGWKIEFFGSSRLTKLMESGIQRFDGSKKYIATADVSDTSITSFSTKITFDERPSRANMQPKINSVWFAKMKDSRKLIRVSENSSYLLSKCIFSTGFAGIETINSLNYIWTYLISTDFDETKNNLCNGTTMQAINNDNIKRIRILSPNIHVLKMYEDLVQPLFDLVESNSIQNDKLAKTRDELLPKLMSGEIEVPIEE